MNSDIAFVEPNRGPRLVNLLVPLDNEAVSNGGPDAEVLRLPIVCCVGLCWSANRYVLQDTMRPRNDALSLNDTEPCPCSASTNEDYSHRNAGDSVISAHLAEESGGEFENVSINLT